MHIHTYIHIHAYIHTCMDVSVAEWLAWLTSNCGRIGAIVIHQYIQTDRHECVFLYYYYSDDDDDNNNGVMMMMMMMIIIIIIIIIINIIIIIIKPTAKTSTKNHGLYILQEKKIYTFLR